MVPSSAVAERGPCQSALVFPAASLVAVGFLPGPLTAMHQDDAVVCLNENLVGVVEPHRMKVVTELRQCLIARQPSRGDLFLEGFREAYC